MYNDKIIQRLSNLIYLSNLKNSNVSIMSKKNKFGDIVKFSAQINTNNVIQKIRYKATGCTYFMALCSYFCEIVEGKSLRNAKKITANNLKEFAELDESRQHVYSIILDTFNLLIKKYEKGVEKGKIIPCEVETKVDKLPIKETTKPKENKKIIEAERNIINNENLSLKDKDDKIYVETTKLILSTKENNITKESNNLKAVKDKNDNKKVKANIITQEKIEEPKNSKKENASKSIEKQQKLKSKSDETIELKTKKADQEVKNSTKIKDEKTNDVMSSIQDTNNEKTIHQADNLKNLRLALQNQKVHEEKKEKDDTNEKIRSLNKMISSMSISHKSDDIERENTNAKKVDTNSSKEQVETKKEKKRLFSWFNKK